MIKITFVPSAAVIMILLTFACSNKKETDTSEQNAEVKNEDWKEMDNFHLVMAEAFHPYKDSANLLPAKENAAALVDAADQWAQAPVPARYEDDDEIKFKLSQLKADASKFAEVAKAGDDKSVGQSLTKLHDLFHEIQESWYGHSDEHQ